jgi:hypothetical protein
MRKNAFNEVIFVPALDTVDTTRLPYDNPVDIAVTASQMLWPDPEREAKRPKVVILAPRDQFQYSYPAASLVHDPIMGDLLLSPTDTLPDIVAGEIKRINPAGTNQLPPVVMVGPFDQTVINAVQNLDFGVLNVVGKNAFSTATKVARLREEIAPQSPEGPLSLFIVSADDPYEGVLAAYYATHSGVPILLTQRDRLAKATARFLSDFPDKYVYIVGGRRAISDSVARDIAALMKKPVTRISGRNAFATAVEFAKFYDPASGLGWNRNEKGLGDAFTFANIETYNLAAAGANFAHEGKHTPLLLVREDAVPPVVADYLTDLKPPLTVPPHPPFMHGFILGDNDIISYTTQVSLELLMKIDNQ